MKYSKIIIISVWQQQIDLDSRGPHHLHMSVEMTYLFILSHISKPSIRRISEKIGKWPLVSMIPIRRCEVHLVFRLLVLLNRQMKRVFLRNSKASSWKKYRSLSSVKTIHSIELHLPIYSFQMPRDGKNSMICESKSNYNLQYEYIVL